MVRLNIDGKMLKRREGVADGNAAAASRKRSCHAHSRPVNVPPKKPTPNGAGASGQADAQGVQGRVQIQLFNAGLGVLVAEDAPPRTAGEGKKERQEQDRRSGRLGMRETRNTRDVDIFLKKKKKQTVMLEKKTRQIGEKQECERSTWVRVVFPKNTV